MFWRELADIITVFAGRVSGRVMVVLITRWHSPFLRLLGSRLLAVASASCYFVLRGLRNCLIVVKRKEQSSCNLFLSAVNLQSILDDERLHKQTPAFNWKMLHQSDLLYLQYDSCISQSLAETSELKVSSWIKSLCVKANSYFISVPHIVPWIVPWNYFLFSEQKGVDHQINLLFT